MICFGIDRVCTSAFADTGPDCVFGNNLVAKTIKDYPDKFIEFEGVE